MQRLRMCICIIDQTSVQNHFKHNPGSPYNKNVYVRRYNT